MQRAVSELSTVRVKHDAEELKEMSVNILTSSFGRTAFIGDNNAVCGVK